MTNDQSWFWTTEWQAGEAQATTEAALGLGDVYETSGDFIRSLTPGKTHE